MNGIVNGLTYTIDGAPILPILTTQGNMCAFYDTYSGRELEISVTRTRANSAVVSL